MSFVVDKLAPLLLDFDSGGGSFEEFTRVNSDVFRIAFEERHHFRAFDDFLEMEGLGVVIENHSDKLFHDEFVLALKVSQRLVVLMLDEFVDPGVCFFGF